MNICSITFCGVALHALPSGALWWPDRDCLTVSDLHLGKSERIARQGGSLLPPYEVIDTLGKLQDDLSRTKARTLICLGDSFDDLSASRGLDPDVGGFLTRLMAGIDWNWIEGNHDPGPLELGGAHRREMRLDPLVFRHIAEDAAEAEVSGHYHPKHRLTAKGRSVSRPCLIFDAHRMVLPAYGTYTGGLRSDDAAISALFPDGATAILTGPRPCAVPVPKANVAETIS